MDDAFETPLKAEARLFGRYLVGSLPSSELVDRYVAAHRAVFSDDAGGDDASLVRFIHRHPWSLPFLDAAAGLFRAGGGLRNKILLCAAVLEASPDYADSFLPRHASLPRLVLQGGWLASSAIARLLGGMMLLPWARRA